MKTQFAIATALALSTALPTISFAGNGVSPVFGKAKINVMSNADARKVVGKGTTSDYYGYYGNLYNNYAAYYGNIGLYYNDYSNERNGYYYAYYYSYYAYQNYYYAYYYAGS